jgi:hypothetical protein
MTRARSSHVDVMRQCHDVAIQRRCEFVRDQINSVAEPASEAAAHRVNAPPVALGKHSPHDKIEDAVTENVLLAPSGKPALGAMPYAWLRRTRASLTDARFNPSKKTAVEFGSFSSGSCD